MYDLILWKNRRTEKANTYAVTQNPDKTITLTPVPGEIIEPGTGFNQQNMNHMDNGINEANIYAAYLDARKGKSERNEIMRFSLELDAHLNDLYNDLQEERYKVSGYRIIYIYVPKKRLIMALQFRDRVLQWAVYRLLNPLYEKTYIKDSYACIKERGREKAASRLQYWLRQTERKPKQYYYLKLDISKFFYRVDHEVLLNILKRRIKDERLIKLFDKIINSEKRAFGLPLGVDPCEIDPREMLFDKGMPIGNLTSGENQHLQQSTIIISV